MIKKLIRKLFGQDTTPADASPAEAAETSTAPTKTRRKPAGKAAPAKRDPDVPMHKALGYKYRAIRDRWLGQYQLTQAGVSHGRTRWIVTVRESETQ